MRKYQNGRFQPQIIMEGVNKGYFEIVDTYENCKTVAMGFLSEQDAYNDAYWMNEDEVKRGMQLNSIAKSGQEWLDLAIDTSYVSGSE